MNMYQIALQAKGSNPPEARVKPMGGAAEHAVQNQNTGKRERDIEHTLDK